MAPVFRYLLCFIAVFVFLVFFENLTADFEQFPIYYLRRSNSTRRRRSPARTNVLIVSQGRGGSTFLGEIFNNNPGIFYVYEPLYLAGSILGLNVFYEQETESYSQLCEVILRSFLQCDFSNQTTKLLDVMSRLSGLRSKSNVLSRKQVCPEGHNGRPGKSKKMTCRLSSRGVKQVCEAKKHTVLKVLVSRLPNKTMAFFEQQLRTDKHDLKIIQLVRDPRPVVYSWVKNSWIKGTRDSNLRGNIRRICKPVYDNILFAESQPLWLRGRHKLVRYEELALQPLKVAREIYDFLGFVWPLEVETWLNSTISQAAKSMPKNPYSTVRNGTTEVTRWRSEAPDSLIALVEEECGALLDMMGYGGPINKQMKPSRRFKHQ